MSQKKTNGSSYNGAIIAVTSPRGGMGKTTMSSLLASQIVKSSETSYHEGTMERPLKVCVVDLDIVSPQQGIILDIKGPGALQLSLAGELTSELIRDTLAYSPELGYKALLGSFVGFGEMTEVKVVEMYRKTLSILRTMFDVIIVDTSSYPAGDLNQKIFEDADAILLATTTGITQFVSMRHWINNTLELRAKGEWDIDIHKVYLVINQVHSELPIDEPRLKRANLGMPVLASIPVDPFVFQKFYDTRQSHEIISLHAGIGEAYFNLAQNLLAKCNLSIKVALSPIVKER